MTARRSNAGKLLIGVLSLLVSTYCRAAVASFTSGFQTGNIQNASITEASGIAASRMNPNVLWTHDDSGNPAQIFALTSAGTNLGTYTISGASNVDWEDIAIGPGPVAGSQYMYIGDIGDNLAVRSDVSVYRVPEPTVGDLQSPLSTNLAGTSKFTFAYPDGPRDAESMFVDPLTRDIYIISKRENPKHLYRAAYPQSTSGTTTLQLMTTFLTDSTWLTAADISPDGNEIIVRSTGNTSGRVYVHPPGGSITDTLNSAAITIPLLSEPQGEAIGFDPDGRGYFTISEGSNQPIYYFDRIPPSATPVYWNSDGVAAGSYIASGVGLGGNGTWDDSSPKWYHGGANVRWLAGNNAVFTGISGTVTLSATQTAISVTFKSNAYTLSSGALNLTGPSVTVDSGITATISSDVKGSAGLNKNGGGTLRLTSSNTYVGGTTVSAGKLIVNNTAGSGTGTGAVAVHATASLGGTGTVNGDVSNSGTITPGDAIGTLHITGTYNQSAGGNLIIDLASTASYDQLAISGTASIAGTLNVILSGGFTPQAGNSFSIVTTSGFGGSTFTTTNLPPLPEKLAWNVNYGANSLILFVTLMGDFDLSGAVDAADYVWWRQFDSTPAGYNAWRSHFGQTVPAAAPAAGVPEPTALALIAVVAATFLRLRRTRC